MKAEVRWGRCQNCGMNFTAAQHYPLSAHEPQCWGADGRTPHPLNPALAPEELAHRRKAAVLKAKATRAAA